MSDIEAKKRESQQDDTQVATKSKGKPTILHNYKPGLKKRKGKWVYDPKQDPMKDGKPSALHPKYRDPNAPPKNESKMAKYHKQPKQKIRLTKKTMKY